jgi:penicillin-binding protein 1A
VATTSKGSPEDRTPRHARNRSRATGATGSSTSTRRAASTGAGARATRAAARPASAKRTPAKRAGGSGSGAERGFFRRNQWKFVVLAPLGLALFSFLVLLIAYVRIDVPKALPPVQTTFVYDQSGRLLSSIHGSVDRTLIPFQQMPEHTRDAVIAVEDARFYEHSGVDLRGTIRAAWADLVAGDAVQGGSTITQQLVKRVYAGRYTEPDESGIREYVIPPRTVKEKVREVLLAMKVERTLSKDEILQRYLNTVYFGHGAYGIEAAARTYFDIPARRLSVLQSATLAGILTAPEAYDPIDHPFDAKFRRDFALDRMVRYGYMEADEAERLKGKPCCGIPLDAQEGRDAQIDAPLNSEYFVQYVKETLTERYGSAEVFGGGLKVKTTLDLDLEAAAEDAIQTYLPSPDDPGAALVAVDPRNGQILAMAGGRDFSTSQLNLATFRGGSGRQAGSAFKAFTLAEAMEQHVSLDSTWYGPDTITIDDPICADEHGEPWQPENAEGGGGTYTLRSATANSVNTVFAQLVVELGPENVVKMAHRLGIQSKLPAVCSVTLGSVAVNPLEMTNAYATLADGGVRHQPTPLLQVRSPGRGLDPGLGSKDHPAVNPNVAALVTDTLRDVLEYGTGASAQISPWPAAGKTGTAQENVDAWFCGYTVQVAACVWVGYPRGQIPLEDVEGVPLVYGGTIPAAIWHDFMMSAMDGLTPESFPAPNFGAQTATPSAAAPPPAPSPSAEPSAEPSSSPSPEPSPEPSPSPSPPSPTPSPPARPEDRGG